MLGLDFCCAYVCIWCGWVAGREIMRGRDHMLCQCQPSSLSLTFFSAPAFILCYNATWQSAPTGGGALCATAIPTWDLSKEIIQHKPHLDQIVFANSIDCLKNNFTTGITFIIHYSSTFIYIYLILFLCSGAGSSTVIAPPVSISNNSLWSPHAEFLCTWGQISSHQYVTPKEHHKSIFLSMCCISGYCTAKQS